MKREMLRQAEQYGEKASYVYCSQIVSVIICAAANCLGINLAAFQNIGGKAVIINTLCTKKPSDVMVFLKYNHNVHNPVGNHYSAIVLIPVIGLCFCILFFEWQDNLCVSGSSCML